MKRKRKLIQKSAVCALTMTMIALQLCGCAAVTQSELVQMCMNNQAITIEVAEPISSEQGEEVQNNWEYLAYLDTYKDFRLDVDDILYITKQGEKGKNGVIYVDQDGNHTDNATLYMAFQNEKFIKNYWKDADIRKELVEAARTVYVDIETDNQALLSMVNGYWNLLNDSRVGYANLNSTLTRGEFLAFILKADTPVHEIEGSDNFRDVVGGGEYAVYASEVADDISWLGISDKSLDSQTFNGTITRAEAIYSLIKRYYGEEYESITGKEGVSYSDAKNGGDISLKAGFSVEEKIKGTKEVVRTDPKERYNSYELAYALQNPEGGMPEALYKALVVADRHNLISNNESRWDEGLTKGEALDLIITVYEVIGKEKGYVVSADRGEAKGLASTNKGSDETVEDSIWENGVEGLYVYDGVLTVDDDTMEALVNRLSETCGYSSKLREMFNDALHNDIRGVLTAHARGEIDDEAVKKLIEQNIMPDNILEINESGEPIMKADLVNPSSGNNDSTETETASNESSGNNSLPSSGGDNQVAGNNSESTNVSSEEHVINTVTGEIVDNSIGTDDPDEMRRIVEEMGGVWNDSSDITRTDPDQYHGHFE